MGQTCDIDCLRFLVRFCQLLSTNSVVLQFPILFVPTLSMSNFVAYGPNENCTLAICPVNASVYEYRPSLVANSLFLALFGVCLILHLIQGLKWRTWFFGIAMFVGCVCEIIGYGGRITLYKNPFSFPGFLMQISKYRRSNANKYADTSQYASHSAQRFTPRPST